jgi:hypothetical protein
MNRREFITVLGGAAAWPARQERNKPKLPKIGVLVIFASEPFWSPCRGPRSS